MDGDEQRETSSSNKRDVSSRLGPCVEPSTSKGAELRVDGADLANNPQLKALFNQFYDERCRMQEGNSGKKDGLGVNDNTGKCNQLQCIESNVKADRLIKSPSDTTIYAPALNRICDQNQQFQTPVRLHMTQEQRTINDEQINDHVANFVETMRQSYEGTPNKAIDKGDSGLDEVRKCTEAALVEAEKFKAKVATPPGRLTHNFDQMQIQGDDSRVMQNEYRPEQLNCSSEQRIMLGEPGAQPGFQPGFLQTGNEQI